MSLPRAIVLAAGQGSRLGALAAGRPKCLMPVAGEPLLLRTLRQLCARGFTDIVVVVGFQAGRVTEAVHSVSTTIRCIENAQYATDTNIRSLLVGLENRDAPALVIEADIAFDDAALDVLTATARTAGSAWFTNGFFNATQLGGILRADRTGRLVELSYVPAYAARYEGCHKLIGAVYAGPKEMPIFHQLLWEAAARTTGQYYMMPWCEHLGILPARAVDLAHCRTATFNTPEDYWRCEALFARDALISA
jgi:choline kinase